MFIIKEFLFCILEYFIIAMVFIGFILVLALTTPQTIYHYEYIDLDNNKGIAVDCSFSFHEHKAGGQGSPICILPEGTVIQVKQYTKIVESTCVPYKDKNLCNR